MVHKSIKRVWSHTNRLGETFLYGKVGSGKDSYIKTLAYLGKNKEDKVVFP